jgi:hypothetical protein
MYSLLKSINNEVLNTRSQTNSLDLLLIKKDLHVKFKIILVISKLLVQLAKNHF